MKKHAKMSVLKRILAVVIAAAVAVSILTVPEAEVSAATGKVKSVAVTNLPAKQLTLKKGKTFTLKSKVTVTGKASKKVTYKTSNKKIATVSAKGKITAKKKGTAKIYVISKANKKKKYTITVTVGTPVTKVTLNKKKSTMTVGKKQTLKATITPKKASSKAVVWKSSNKKVATVTKKGVVTAKKAGTVKITALAKDGSGKKSTCTITVKAKKKQNTPNQDKPKQDQPKQDPQKPAAATVIKDIKVVNSFSVQVTISAAKALSAADFAVYTKEYPIGTYKRQCVVDHVSSKDGMTYVLTLDDESGLSELHYVKVVIAKYNIEKEIYYYVSGSGKYTDEDIYRVAAGTTMSVSNANYSYSLGGMGYSTVTVSGLPAGIKYKTRQSVYDTSVQFYGSPVRTGTYTTTIVAVDELGNMITHTLTWMIYSDTAISAASEPVYLLCDGTRNAEFYQTVTVFGGSGTYTYAFSGESYGCTIDENGEIYGKFSKAGNYPLTVVVTDQNDPSVQTTAKVMIYVKQAVTISGIVTDMDGNPISHANVHVSNRNYGSRYCVEKSDYTDTTGEYFLMVEPGSYDVQVTYANASRNLYSQTMQVSRSDYNIKLPVYKVELQADNAKIDPALFGDWYDTDYIIYGSGDTLYLKNGSYTLTASQGFKSPYVYEAVLNVTVAGKAVTATAKTTLKTEEIDIKTGTDQKLTLASKDDAKLLRFTADATGSYIIKVPAISGFNGKGMITVFRGDGSFMVAHGFDSESGTSISFYVVKGATYSFKILTDSDAPVTFTYDLTEK